ncbi:MAG: META domain-containing protein [Xanthomonadales bacterium]|nr:META domain-containing protein [Xanthomonadales bacterium]
MKTRIFLALALLSAFLVACGGSEEPEVESAETGAVSGTVTYRERIALSDSAVVEIQLQDVSRQDAPAGVLARQRITNPGQVPIAFELVYDPKDIDERMSYSVSARIIDGGQLRFVSDTATPVLTRGAGNRADLVLTGVRAPGVGKTMPFKSRKKTPEQVASGFEMTGMFRYLADAARFRACGSTRSFPVAMEGDYLELENAYLKSGVEPGEEIMVAFTGRRLERPSMEGNHSEVKIIVDKFNKLLPDNACPETARASLTDTYWKLVEVNSEEVVTPPGMKEAHLVLGGTDSRARGHAGCNRFFGGFEADEASLAFSALGSTMMACPETMDTERAFLAALDATASFVIQGEVLELLDGPEGNVLARLEAVYL